jgi:hypothetical protein
MQMQWTRPQEGLVQRMPVEGAWQKGDCQKVRGENYDESKMENRYHPDSMEYLTTYPNLGLEEIVQSTSKFW